MRLILMLFFLISFAGCKFAIRDFNSSIGELASEITR